MPPLLALFLTTGFVVFLFRRDARQNAGITWALWIPLVWVLITCSRSVSEWLGFGGTYNTPADLADGSPLDRLVFLSLQVAGVFVLARRRLSWSTVISRNFWMIVFLAYCGLAIVWSDFQFVAFKRWLKVLGLPMMVLILATEPDPREAVLRLMKRAAYILVPFSILLIKYYPHLGRGFSSWTGAASNHGVTTNKNELGYVCLILGAFFFWHLLTTLRRPRGIERRNEVLLSVAFLAMIGWLLAMANSATALTALATGMAVLVFFGLGFIDRRYSVVYVVAALVLISAVEMLFGATDAVIAALGRGPTLSGRVELWQRLQNIDINPIVGAGFESFWLGRRAELLWAEYWWRPNQAHNGYLETYLNLGSVGVILLAAWIAATFWKSRAALLTDFDYGRFRLAAIAIILVYNYTEGAFKGVHPVWFMFYLVSFDYPKARTRTVQGRAPAALGSRSKSQRLSTAPPHSQPIPVATAAAMPERGSGD